MRPATSGEEAARVLQRVERRLQDLGASLLRIDGFDFSDRPTVYAGQLDLDRLVDTFGPMIGIWYVAPLEPAPGIGLPAPVGYLLAHIHADVLYQWEVLAEDYTRALEQLGQGVPKVHALGGRETKQGAAHDA